MVVINWYRKALILFTSVSLVLMSIVVMMQVFYRYVLNDSLVWSEDVARYLQVYITFLGAALALRKGMHLGVDFVVSLLKEKIQARLNILNYVIVALFSLFLISAGTKLILEQAAYKQMILSLPIPVPMYLVYIALPLGGLFLLVESIIYIAQNYKADTVKVDEEGA